MRGILRSVMTMEGFHCVRPSPARQTPSRGSFSAIAPGGNQFGEPGALVLFVFDDQYFFLAHSLVLALVLVWPFFTRGSCSLRLEVQPYAARLRRARCGSGGLPTSIWGLEAESALFHVNLRQDQQVLNFHYVIGKITFALRLRCVRIDRSQNTGFDHC